MSQSEFQLALLRDERLAPVATSALPAWLWSADASRILWANPIGAAIFGAASSAAIHPRLTPVAGGGARIAQLAPPAAGRLAAPRAAARVRAGVGARVAMRVCASLTDDAPAILVVATERARYAQTDENGRAAPARRMRPTGRGVRARWRAHSRHAGGHAAPCRRDVARRTRRCGIDGRRHRQRSRRGDDRSRADRRGPYRQRGGDRPARHLFPAGRERRARGRRRVCSARPGSGRGVLSRSTGAHRPGRCDGERGAARRASAHRPGTAGERFRAGSLPFPARSIGGAERAASPAALRLADG